MVIFNAARRLRSYVRNGVLAGQRAARGYIQNRNRYPAASTVRAATRMAGAVGATAAAAVGSGVVRNMRKGGVSKRIQGDTADGQRGRYIDTKKKKTTKRQQYKKKQWGKFRSKVQKAIEPEQNYGYVSKLSTMTLYQDIRDEWRVSSADHQATELMFFNPRKIIDAYSIAFNNKTNSAVSQLSDTNNVNNKTVLRIGNSWAKFYFRNVSQHKMRIEMYITYGLDNLDNNTMNNSFSNYGTNFVGGNETNLNVIGSEIWHIPAIKKHWKYEKVVFVLDMGQEQTHYIQGPKNLTYDMSKHLYADATYLRPNIKGNGCLVFFRTCTEPTITYDSPNRITHREPNGTGGVAVEYREFYLMRSLHATADTYDRNCASISSTWPTATGSDRQVNVDNPAVVISTPL